MKKILALLLAAGIFFSFAGCNEGKSDIEKLQDEIEDFANQIEDSVNDFDIDINDDLTDDDDSTVANTTIAEYIELIKNTEEYELIEQMAELGSMTFDMVAEGNDLVYKYTYTIEVLSDAAEILEESIDGSQGDILKESADTLREEISGLRYLIIEYYSVDGELIADFKF